MRAAQPADADAVVAALVLAYAADPVLRFILRAPDRYRDGAAEMMRVGVALGLAHGTLDVAANGAAAALWTAPGVRLGEARVAELMQRIVEPERQPEVFAGLAAAGHPESDAPSWYLQTLGVDPALQGRGLGSALLRHGLARVDGGRAPVALQCSNPRNVALYERHGFEVVARVAMNSEVDVIHMRRAAVL